MSNMIGIITTNYEDGSFGPLTSERPIASLPFGGRYRLIDFPLSNMVNSGISTVGLITPYMYRSLMDHVGVGKEWTLARKVGGLYFLPGSIYGLKSKHSRFLIRDLNQNRAYLERGGGDHVVISASHNIFNIDFAEVEKAHIESGRDITLIYKEGLNLEGENVLYLKSNSSRRVTDIIQGIEPELKYFIEAFIINRDLLLSILEWYSNLGYMDLVEIFSEHISDFNIGAYEFKGYVGVVNNLKNYMEASLDLLRSDVREQLFNPLQPIATKVQDSPPAKFLETAHVKSSLISSGSIVEGTVENSIIFRDTHIRKGAVIKNCIIMQHGDIGAGACLSNVICDKYVKIKPGVSLSASYESPMAISKGSQI